MSLLIILISNYAEAPVFPVALYTAAAKIKSNGKLEVNGYLGFSFFGIKKNFKRLK